jgi:hypothetical protein
MHPPGSDAVPALASLHEHEHHLSCQRVLGQHAFDSHNTIKNSKQPLTAESIRLLPWLHFETMMQKPHESIKSIAKYTHRVVDAVPVLASLHEHEHHLSSQQLNNPTAKPDTHHPLFTQHPYIILIGTQYVVSRRVVDAVPALPSLHEHEHHLSSQRVLGQHAVNSKNTKKKQAAADRVDNLAPALASHQHNDAATAVYVIQHIYMHHPNSKQPPTG